MRCLTAARAAGQRSWPRSVGWTSARDLLSGTRRGRGVGFVSAQSYRRVAGPAPAEGRGFVPRGQHGTVTLCAVDPSFFLRGAVLGFTIAATVGPITMLTIRRTLAY